MQIAKAEYDLVTAESVCKMGTTVKSFSSFDYSMCDQVHYFALQNKMAFRGHALAWARPGY